MTRDRYIAIDLGSHWGVADMGGKFAVLVANVIGGVDAAVEVATLMSSAVADPSEPFA